MKNSHFPSHLAMALATLLFGINYWIAKGLMPDYLLPLQVIFLRITGALILFILIQFSIRELRIMKIERRDWLRLALASLLGVAINQVMFFIGLNKSTPVDAAIINSTNPVLVLLFAYFILKEGITYSRLAGIVSGAAGALMLILYGHGPGTGLSGNIGNLFIFINTVSYALYLVIAKPLMVKYHPIVLMKWMFVFGLLFTLPVVLYDSLAIDFPKLTVKAWMSILYVILATTFLAYLLITYAMKRLSTPVVAYYTYVQPVLVALIGLVVAYEKLSFVKIASALLVFAGIYLVTRPKKDVAKGN